MSGDFDKARGTNEHVGTPPETLLKCLRRQTRFLGHERNQDDALIVGA